MCDILKTHIAMKKSLNHKELKNTVSFVKRSLTVRSFTVFGKEWGVDSHLNLSFTLPLSFTLRFNEE